MFKLTLTSDDSGPTVLPQLSRIAQTLGIAVEAVGLDGYVIGLVHPPSMGVIPAPNFSQFQPSPVTTPVPTVEVTPEPPVEG